MSKEGNKCMSKEQGSKQAREQGSKGGAKGMRKMRVEGEQEGLTVSKRAKCMSKEGLFA
jgi:hypothetical protein